MITVTLNNSGGELDHREVRTAEQAAAAAVELIQSAGVLYDGDTITVSGDEE